MSRNLEEPPEEIEDDGCPSCGRLREHCECGIDTEPYEADGYDYDRAEDGYLENLHNDRHRG